LTGFLVGAVPWLLLAGVFVAAAGFAFLLDQIKLPIMAAFKIR
jgi:hypothetical protein